ncbi:glycosyltransferase [Gephyromycinifex aptenodytis]|uniref:glycosyltransferase n=1 Tax=Gephyromycinifex aptenodytis TaxID=2716227 RepID=UPI0014472986|nr:glycosyltransferase [Gephyromycinifex aptenodytis]
MRILLVTNSYPSVHSPSGAAYISARVRALRAAGASVVAVALVPEYGPELGLPRRLAGAHDNAALALDDGRDGREFLSATTRWGALEVAAGRLGRTPAAGIARATAALADLPQVRSGQFDIIHAHGMYTLPAGEVARRAAQNLGIPFVVSMHGSDVTQVMPRVAPAFTATLEAAAATTYVSEALRSRALAAGAPRAHSHVIPNGVDLSVFTPRQAHSAQVPGPLRLLFVGNLLPVKGADRLPAILSAVRERYPGSSMDVLGSGALETRLRGVPGLRLHGRLDAPQVAQAMRQASALIVPSREEGWGCVVSESYACATPVIATAVGGLVEAVLDPAHLVNFPPEASPAQEGQAFADVLQALMDEPPTRDRMLAHVARCGWGEVAGRELAVLEGAMS